MVTTYPPTQCGIGSYGEQSVNQLRSQGHIVDIASPDQQGNVDYAWDLRGGSKILRLRKLLPYYDKVVIQYHWAFFYQDLFNPRYRADSLMTTLSFLWLVMSSQKIEIVAHEIPYLNGRTKWLFGLMWKLTPKLVLHTESERRRFEEHYGMRLLGSRVEMRKHHDVFQKFTGLSQASARRELGIMGDERVFLCIGFIQRHKGFHRAVRAFLKGNLEDSELYVVGSMRVADEENQKYLRELRELAQGNENVKIVEQFVSNEEFDMWITAADWVVIPYSEIWSSGVLARTRLLGRPAIVAFVGGLPDQTGEGDILFKTDEELMAAFRTAASRALPQAHPETTSNSHAAYS